MTQKRGSPQGGVPGRRRTGRDRRRRDVYTYVEGGTEYDAMTTQRMSWSGCTTGPRVAGSTWFSRTPASSCGCICTWRIPRGHRAASGRGCSTSFAGRTRRMWATPPAEATSTLTQHGSPRSQVRRALQHSAHARWSRSAVLGTVITGAASAARWTGTHPLGSTYSSKQWESSRVNDPLPACSSPSQQQLDPGWQSGLARPETSRRGIGAGPGAARVAGGAQSKGGAVAGSTGSAGSSSWKCPA